MSFVAACKCQDKRLLGIFLDSTSDSDKKKKVKSCVNENLLIKFLWARTEPEMEFRVYGLIST